MAKSTTTAAGTKGSNPVIPPLVAPPVTTPPAAAPAVTAPPAVAEAASAAATTAGEKKRKYQVLFDSAEAALAEANKREKGPRRAFTTKGKDGVVRHVVANNEICANHESWLLAGGECEEIGVEPKAKKPKALTSIDAVLEALNGMNEADRATALEALKKLGAAPATA